ncbi:MULTISPECIES: homogentisate 1,2-dioxygenase [unclassified Sphingobium]|uniref:homogentisate 1,2-dioxygenase n=1 Tax=unclassified Sphingobium TaxID=2611147 RepID=UPI0022243391|nr:MULTISPECIES: homogentisate 1,2-dioxygenase [unclassified Sphingobium]MCW2395330.1 hypothetical protein [Sphingobium sp. B8D3B]MCW2418845.1 hypothetical protein [Sphingobium sp. B8D3C]
MRMMMALAMALAPVAVAAQMPAADAPACADDAALPPEFAAWRNAERVVSATEAAVQLKPGQAVDLTLSPASSVAFAAAPERAAKPGTYAGRLAFDAPRDGVYRVALGAAAWVDMVTDGARVPSLTHGHGPACSGIRKIVDFRLKAGRHILQISGSEAPVIRAMIVPATE